MGTESYWSAGDSDHALECEYEKGYKAGLLARGSAGVDPETKREVCTAIEQATRYGARDLATAFLHLLNDSQARAEPFLRAFVVQVRDRLNSG